MRLRRAQLVTVIAVVTALSLALSACRPREAKRPIATRQSNSVAATVPTDMVFASSGDLYFTEKGGRLRLLPSGSRRSRTLLTIPVPKIAGYNETGLLGLALHPDFAKNKLVYLYYSRDLGGSYRGNYYGNRVARVNIDKPEEERIIIDQLPGNVIHNAGKLTFGPDGKLYVAVGDADNRELAQDKKSLNGKILRLNPDGTVPKDNPFPGSPVFSYGHRNIFGMAFDPRGRLIVTENGPESNDEINLVKGGGNYGWPMVTGNSRGRYEDPLVVFQEVNAPTGIIYFRRAGTYLKSLAGSMLFGDYINGGIHSLRLNKDEATSEIVIETGAPITALAQSPSGRLWVAQERRIYRLEPR